MSGTTRKTSTGVLLVAIDGMKNAPEPMVPIRDAEGRLIGLLVEGLVADQEPVIENGYVIGYRPRSYGFAD